MMRALILLFIAGVAGLIGYLAFVGECTGGTVVRSEAQCRENLSQGLCRTIFARANEVARSTGSVYMNPTECSVAFGSCLDHATIVGGYVPAPAGFCVRASGDTLTGMEPVYRRAAVRQ
jgi:uncharacterized protein YgiB involved in biofilm formation